MTKRREDFAMTDMCKTCKASGLAIMPARYAVVPADFPSKPLAFSGENVISIALDAKQYKYAARTLRAGYLYLFYEKGPRGKDYWEGYPVAQDGHLGAKEFDLQLLKPAGEKIQCSRSGHTGLRTSHFVIDKPESCTTVWVGFSEHKWIPDTVAFYTKAANRPARMQPIKPASWINAPHAGKHALPASLSAIQTLAEWDDSLPYGQGFEIKGLPNKAKPPVLSKEDGTYSTSAMQMQSTLTPWHLHNLPINGHKDEAVKRVIDMMEQRSPNPKGKKGEANEFFQPMLLALWDAVGITHELNGYRSDAAGKIGMYVEERALQITALNGIDGAQKTMAQRIQQRFDSANDEQIRNQQARAAQDQQTINGRRIRAQRASEPYRSRELETCSLMDAWNKRFYPMDLVFSSVNYINQLEEPRRSQELAKFKAEVEKNLAERDRNEREMRAEVPGYAAERWKDYEERLNRSRLEKFRVNHDAFFNAADSLIDRRTVELIKWLEAVPFIATLEDYNDANINDGVAFESVVGDAIYGINSSPAGQKKLDEWIKQAKSTVKENLVWRAITLNQKDAKAEIDAALAVAFASPEALTEKTWTTLLAHLKSLQRTADVYKKAQGVYNSNLTVAQGASSNKPALAFGAPLKSATALGLDKVAMAVGDRMYAILGIAKGVDAIGEKIIQHILSMRAFIEPNDSMNLIYAQATREKLSRAQTIQRLKLARAFMEKAPELINDPALKTAWANFKANDARAPINIKDARLAIVVGLIEMAYFGKLAFECKGDLRSIAMLVASGMTIVSAAYDVATIPAKSIYGSDAWTFQKFKLIGGTLAAGASIIGGFVALFDAVKNRKNAHNSLMYLYLGKSVFSFASAIGTIGATCSYAAPLLQRLTGRVAVGAVARAVGARAVAVVGARILFMTAGAWVTVGLVIIEVLIWTFTPDALETWCDRSAFAKTPNDSYTSAEDQLAGVLEAISKVT
jgi:hypothetical protein